MFFAYAQSALKQAAFAGVLATALVQGAHATETVKKADLTYGYQTARSMYNAGLSLKPTGSAKRSTSDNGDVTLTFPITSKDTSSDGTKLYHTRFASSGLTFSKGSRSVSFDNMLFAFSDKTIYARQIGGSNSFKLFDADSITGGKLPNGSFSYVATGFNLTSGAVSLLSSRLGLSSSYLRGLDFGSMSIQLTVPEPSTYALLGLGLACVSVVARRRRLAA